MADITKDYQHLIDKYNLFINEIIQCVGDEKLYSVYKITEIETGVFYIGKNKGSKYPFNDYFGSSRDFTKYMNERGYKKFRKEILFIFDNEKESYQKERELQLEAVENGEKIFIDEYSKIKNFSHEGKHFATLFDFAEHHGISVRDAYDWIQQDLYLKKEGLPRSWGIYAFSANGCLFAYKEKIIKSRTSLTLILQTDKIQLSAIYYFGGMFLRIGSAPFS